MILIVVIGFFLRIHDLEVVPLRGDESFAVQSWARQPLAVSLTQTATIEPHPVLTYAVFRVWGLVTGTTPFLMRLLPALAGLLCIPAIYVIGRSIGGAKLGLTAAVLFSVHPYEIWHAQDARNYAIWAGFSLVALALGLQACKSRKTIHWFLYGTVATVTTNLFYMEMLTLVAFGAYVFVAYRRHWQVIRNWLLVATVAIFTSTVSFLVLQGTLVSSGAYGGTTPTRLELPRLLSWFFPTLMFGETLPGDFVGVIWPFIGIVVLAGLGVLWHRHRRSAIFLGLLGIIPFTLLSLAALRFNIFNPRYILSVAPIFTLVGAAFIWQLSTRRQVFARVIALIVVAAWIIVSGFSLLNYYANPVYVKSKNWPALTHYLHEQTQPDDLIIQLSIDAAFGYYFHENPSSLPLDIALPANEKQPPDEIRRLLHEYTSQHPSVWLVGQTFPYWPNAGVVENWLNANMQLVRTGQASDLKFWQYMNWQVNPDEIQGQPLATFSDIIELTSFQTHMPPERNGLLTVWLYWRPIDHTETPLKVFVHLTGEINPVTGTPLWTQDDRYPQNGQIGTTNWELGRVYRDIYALPLAHVQSGRYELRAGFYDPEDGQRLSVGTDDSFVLRSLELE
jgi:hypothetical protein